MGTLKNSEGFSCHQELQVPQNDKAISFILGREVLGISHFKFQLNQACLYLCSPKNCKNMQSLCRNSSTMGYKAKPEQFPQLINIRSAAVVLILVKAARTPLNTKAYEIKPRNSIETPLHFCIAALPRWRDIDTEVLNACNPTEQQIHLCPGSRP